MSTSTDARALAIDCTTPTLDLVSGLPVSKVSNTVLEVQGRVEALEEELKKHDERLDDVPEIVVAAVMARLKDEVLNGSSSERLEALINATVRQFDPRFGNQAIRRFWLDRLAKLSDLEVFLLVNISRPIVVFTRGNLHRLTKEQLAEVRAAPATIHDHGEQLLKTSNEITGPVNRTLADLEKKRLVRVDEGSPTLWRLELSDEGELLAHLASRPGQ